MSERDESLGTLAIRLRLITPAALREALEAWKRAPQRDLGSFLAARGDLSHEAIEALRVLEPLAKPDQTTTDRTVVAPSSAPPSGQKPLVVTRAAEEKFTLGVELGRGGLGRVVEADDADLRRTVAMKLLLDGSDAEALARFQHEARVTGRLEHPNIVPVHELGVLPGSGHVYYCMKRIIGRDLAQVIREGKWPLRRLVEAFRDVCRGVAYAHARGIVHRDLKPANVMIGEFGEVLVVDWGLAKEMTSRGDLPAQPDTTTRMGPGTAVMGTPAYMSPEQALGRLQDIDPRSDVWSLGVMLHEILTGRVPFDAPTPRDVVRRILRDELALPPSVPPELAAVCQRALQKSPDARFANAAEFASDIDAFLEGTRERERRAALAAGQLARARDAVTRFRKMRADSAEAADAAKAASRKLEAWEPLEKKRAVWELEDRAAALARASAEAYAECEEALASALSNVPDLPEARKLRAEVHWERYLEAEAAGDERAMVVERRVVESHQDGALETSLKGEGELTVRTGAYACRCLFDGRDVAPTELNVTGVHPWSGRDLSGTRPGPWPAGEDGQSHRLRVHAASCAAVDEPGARVWAFRHVPMDRILVPFTPRKGEAAPEAVLDAAFGKSPYRPRGGGWYLGRTPVERAPLPMGSWLLVVAAEGRVPVRVPVVIARQQLASVGVTLFHPDEVPAGFLPVPAGPSTLQGDPKNDSGGPAKIVDLDDFFLSRFPLTAGEWAEHVNALIRAGEPGAARVPRHGVTGKPFWPTLPDGSVAIPDADFAAAHTDLLAGLARLENCSAPWRADWPVLSNSWIDAQHYARLLSLARGRLYYQPTEEQWEKAARGVDQRPFPWGHVMDGLFGNNQSSQKDGMRPAPVESFPIDESVYGIRGLGGNSAARCLTCPGDRFPDWRIVKGGSWQKIPAYARSAYRQGISADQVQIANGVRLASAVRLTAAAP